MLHQKMQGSKTACCYLLGLVCGKCLQQTIPVGFLAQWFEQGKMLCNLSAVIPVTDLSLHVEV